MASGASRNALWQSIKHGVATYHGGWGGSLQMGCSKFGNHWLKGKFTMKGVFTIILPQSFNHNMPLPMSAYHSQKSGLNGFVAILSFNLSGSRSNNGWFASFNLLSYSVGVHTSDPYLWNI